MNDEYIPSSSEPVGMVLGSEDSTPLTFWVGISEGSYLQLDDPVLVETAVPGRGMLRISGLVQEVRARHEGVSLDSDVFLVDRGVLPAGVARAAKVVATRFEPEIFVPPLPGQWALRARSKDRDEALYFDQIDRRLPAGMSRDAEPIYLDLDFLDGSRGAHVNISGVSGVATKTTYALFLLYSLFQSEALGDHRANTKAIVFNVKGEDLLYLDKANANLDRDGGRSRLAYEKLGLPAGPFESVGLWAPAAARAGGRAIPDTGGRKEGVNAYYWTIREFIREGYLKFLFAEGESERSQIADLVARVESFLARDAEDDPDHGATVRIGGRVIADFDELVDLVNAELDDEHSPWRGRMAEGTIAAFQRRLEAARFRVGHLIWGRQAEDALEHRIGWDGAQVTVVDIHNLHDRAKRFVTGVVVKKLFEHKERQGRRLPLAFLVLDELNRYAPRDGWSPIKEVLLDVAERGRSLGMILIGAEQTASEVERRIIANSAFRVVGRLDTAEAERSEYGFMPAVTRARASILKPGSMILQQPHVPIPMQIDFPFPSWATRPDEVAAKGPHDLFDKFAD